MNKPDYDPRSVFDLSGKRILVTGASMGLGKRFSWTLARAGAEVILAARSEDKLRELADSIAAFGGKCVCVSLDVRDRAAIRETVERIEQAGKAVYVDACLARYRLSFLPNGRFHQSYRGRGSKCVAKVDLKQQAPGYWGAKIHHNLSMKHGQWTTRNQQLYLLDERAGALKTVRYTLENDRLVLHYGDTYRVVLKRAESRR